MKSKYKKTLMQINRIKSKFLSLLCSSLNLIEVNGPLLLDQEIKLNDNLVEDQNAVTFYAKQLNKQIEVVQSLAKWKRFALNKYEFECNEGICVDMKAIRSHELPDYSHSLFVDQWDWELIIDDSERTKNKLKDVVNKIYNCIIKTQEYIFEFDENLKYKLPNTIKFFESQELEDMYPRLSFDEIVEITTKEYKAIFIIGIGKKLKSGKIFDLRSHEYDDWNLNGDLIFWSPILNHSIEISSMGIRVNRDSLIQQSKEKNENLNELSKYYQMILNNELKQTIGGGIGQSRLFMFLLEKSHIGEVQPSIWTESDVKKLKMNNKKIM